MQPWKTVLEVCFWLALAAVFFFGGLLAYRIHIKRVMKTGSRSRWIGLPALMAVLGACYLLVLAAFGSAVAVRRSIRTRGFSYDAPDSIYGLPDALDPAAFAEAASSEKEVLIDNGGFTQFYFDSTGNMRFIIGNYVYVNRLGNYVEFKGTYDSGFINYSVHDEDGLSEDRYINNDDYISLSSYCSVLKSVDFEQVINRNCLYGKYVDIDVYFHSEEVSLYGKVFHNKTLNDYSSSPLKYTGLCGSLSYYELPDGTKTGNDPFDYYLKAMYWFY